MQVVDVLRVARRWLPLALVLAIAAGAGSYLLTKKAIRPTYTSKVTMEVELGLTSQAGTTDPTYNNLFAQTEAQIASQAPTVVQALTAAQKSVKSAPSAAEIASIKKNINCQASAVTALFWCTVPSHDPVFAAAVANSLATVFVQDEKTWEGSRYQAILQRILAEEQAAQRAGDRPRYDSLVQLETSVRLSSAQRGTIVRVVSPAVPPPDSTSPHPLLNASLAFVLVLLLVFGGGLIMNRLDDSIRGEDDLRELSDLPVLGTIPAVRTLRRTSPKPGSLVTVNEPGSAAAEAFRMTRTGIAFSNIDTPPRVLMVTSAVQGEGKSTVAANLAAAFAEEGRSVILVDLDLRRPCLSKIFDVPGTGLTNLLLDHTARAESYLVPTPVPNLRVLPSGPIPPNPAQFVSSQRMRDIVNQLRSAADLVVLDTPPLLAVTDPVVTGALSDTVVLVVRPDQVKRRPLLRAIETLRSRGLDVTGLIINSLARSGGGGYYAYSYGYRESGSKEQKKAPPSTLSGADTPRRVG